MLAISRRCGLHTVTGLLIQRSLHLASSLPIDIAPEVEEALSSFRPIVALESAIITHGLPVGINLRTALSVEQIVRDAGAVPATIGLVEGRFQIGLSQRHIERLSDTESNMNLTKLSTRDLSVASSLKRDGGTTIAATMILARLANIKIFATGGLGGVHRGGESSLDISADLTELGRTPVAVIASGVKSILDIGRTLEYLETQGVPVITYGAVRDFPAFYSPRSGFKSPWNVNSPREVAQVIYTQNQLKISSGIFLAAPIPEEHAESGSDLQKVVDRAVQEAEELGINKRGKEVTPWLLGRVAELSHGRSLKSNVALIENTAAIGARIAVEYSKLSHSSNSHSSNMSLPGERIRVTQNRRIFSVKGDLGLEAADLVVIGAAAVDITAKSLSSPPQSSSHSPSASTVPGTVHISLGGVGRNMGEAAHKILSTSANPRPNATLLISPVGDDLLSQALCTKTVHLGMRIDGFVQAPTPTPTCSLFLNSSGGLVGGVADMSGLQDLDPSKVLTHIRNNKTVLVAMDANLTVKMLSQVVQHCYQNDIPVFYEPTSVHKAPKIHQAIVHVLQQSKCDLTHAPVQFVSPNLQELTQLLHALANHLQGVKWWYQSAVDRLFLHTQFLPMVEQAAASSGHLQFVTASNLAYTAGYLLPIFQHIIVKCGSHGVVVVMHVNKSVQYDDGSEVLFPGTTQIISPTAASGSIVFKHYPALSLLPENIISDTGAGDSLVGVLLAGLVQNPSAFHTLNSLDNLISQAQTAAILSLQSLQAIAPNLSYEKVSTHLPIIR